MAGNKHFAVRLKKSGIGSPRTQRVTLKSLGLRRFGRTVFLKDTPAVRGMLMKVVHHVEVECRDGAVPQK